MPRLAAAVADAVEAAGLRGARIVVAVSGGADSLALLHALAALRDSHALTLHAAHVDHGLRSDSPADADHARRAAAALNIPCDVLPATVARRSDGGASEDAARAARYRALAAAAARVGAAAVATGHTRDDQAETVLLHAVRGAGLAGLRAMRVWSSLPVDGVPLPLLRPLLGVSRADTVAYCDALGLTPADDPTNSDRRYARNLLRTDVFPLLDRINPHAREALARLADSAGLAADYLEEALDAAWPALAAPSADDAVSLHRPALLALHPALQGLAVRRACALAGAGVIDARHVHRLLQLAADPKATGKRVSLPHGVAAEAGRDTLVIIPRAAAARDADPLPETPLACPGAVCVGGWRITASLDAAGGDAALDADALGAPLTVRSRRPGDRFQPRGMARGARKLQDVLVDAHIPRGQRDNLPLLTTTRGIAWVAGVGAAHWAQASPQTARTLWLTAVPRSGG